MHASTIIPGYFAAKFSPKFFQVHFVTSLHLQTVADIDGYVIKNSELPELALRVSSPNSDEEHQST